MKNVVVEGPDNTGKSSLIKSILRELPQLTLIPGGGPEKYPGEINERIPPLFKIEGGLFDRHPCVSQMIYGQIRQRMTQGSSDWPVDLRLLDQFYATKPIFVYCFGPASLVGHVVKEHDTAEHLELVARNTTTIHDMYRHWAEHYATIQFSFSPVRWSVDFPNVNLKAPPANFHNNYAGVIRAIKEQLL